MAATAHPLEGKWQMYKSENFEEFLKAMGANWLVRKAACQFSPCVTITVKGDAVKLETSSMVWTSVDDYVMGQTQEKRMPQGNVLMRMSPAWDGEAIVLKMEPVNEGEGKPHTIRRERVGDEMVTTITVGDIVCKRYFKLVP